MSISRHKQRQCYHFYMRNIKYIIKAIEALSNADIESMYKKIELLDSEKDLINIPNMFSEIYSYKYMKRMKGVQVISGMPNAITKPDNDSGEDVLCVYDKPPYFKMIEVKGNGNNFIDDKFMSLLKKSLDKSFGYTKTKKRHVKNFYDDRQSKKTVHLIKKKRQVQAMKEVVDTYYDESLKLDLKYTESHIYTSKNTSLNNDGIVNLSHERNYMDNTKHEVTLFDTSNLLDIDLRSDNEG